MRGCELCSHQTIARYQGTDEELIEHYEQAREDLARSLDKGAHLEGDAPEPELEDEDE
jgi:hypothetical protein